MFKSFIGGVLLGIAATGAALHYYPAVDQYREASIISVTPNGGNAEVFHVNVPMDRIMLGAQGNANAVPPSLAWPQDPLLEGVQAEVFKLRNSRNAVVGVASRLAASDKQVGDVIEWVLHLPARGSLFATMATATTEGSQRPGELNAGTREFESISGRLTERWVPSGDNSEAGRAGRIELATTFVSSAVQTDEGLMQ